MSTDRKERHYAEAVDRAAGASGNLPDPGDPPVDQWTLGVCRMHAREDCDECFDWRGRAKTYHAALEAIAEHEDAPDDHCHQIAQEALQRG